MLIVPPPGVASIAFFSKLTMPLSVLKAHLSRQKTFTVFGKVF
jgi:hypothetical protein